MTDPDNRQTDPNESSDDLDLENAFSVEQRSAAEKAGDESVYSISEPTPAPPEPAQAVTMPEWYVAIVGSPKQGPMGLLDLQQRVSSGRVTRETLVWKSGMTDWIPAGSVPQLFDDAEPSETSSSSPSGPPPLSRSEKTTEDVTAQAADMLARVDLLFSSPTVFRTAGRVSAALAVVMLPVTAGLSAFGPPGSVLTSLMIILSFLGIFFVGEAAGAILQALKQIESQSEEDEP